MNKIVILAKSNIFNSFNYEIILNNRKIYGYTNNSTLLKDSFNFKKPVLSKIEILDSLKNPVIEIYKLYKTPLNSEAAIIITDGKNYSIEENISYSIPDLSVKINEGSLKLNGTVCSGTYSISLDNINIADIQSVNKNQHKEYIITFNDKYKNMTELFISLTVFLDSKYHFY